MTAVSLFDALDQYEVQFVAVFMSPFSRVIIRATCPYGEKVVAISEKITFMDMIRYSAVDGHRDLCILAHEWGMNRTFDAFGETGFDIMMEYAADCEDPVRARDLCILAKEWNREARSKSSLHFNGMLMHAVARGNQELCEIADDWATQTNSVLDLETMLTRAAGCPDAARARDLCILAKKWGLESKTPLDFDKMRDAAARNGNQELCELARKWKRECMTVDDNRNLSILAREWARGYHRREELFLGYELCLARRRRREPMVSTK